MQGLPNDIIMNIIQLADGGRFEHERKMRKIFSQITNNEPIYWYPDGNEEMCPYFWYEEANHMRNLAGRCVFSGGGGLWCNSYRRGRDIPTDDEEYTDDEDDY